MFLQIDKILFFLYIDTSEWLIGLIWLKVKNNKKGSTNVRNSSCHIAGRGGEIHVCRLRPFARMGFSFGASFVCLSHHYLSVGDAGLADQSLVPPILAPQRVNFVP